MRGFDGYFTHDQVSDPTVAEQAPQ
jgi:hypothetical protein